MRASMNSYYNNKENSEAVDEKISSKKVLHINTGRGSSESIS